LKQALFDAHFQQRRNVSDPEVLVDVATAVGLIQQAPGLRWMTQRWGRLSAASRRRPST
jgi:2-hydroxychromene-2-carboxylate isomerase